MEEQFHTFEIEGWEFTTLTGFSEDQPHDFVDLKVKSPEGKTLGVACFAENSQDQHTKHVLNLFGLSGTGKASLQNFLQSKMPEIRDYPRLCP